MKIVIRHLSLSVVALLIVSLGSATYGAPGKSEGTGGWEPSADHLESVVISLNSDPLVDEEPACVALQLGINLLSDTIMPPPIGISVVPADEVVLFPTIGGVEIVNPANGKPGEPDGLLNEELCLSFTPEGVPTAVSLNQLLQRFTSLGGFIEVCPLCKAERFPDDDPNFDAPVSNGVDIHNLFLFADKVITF